MSLIAELKRRNVFKVAVAYLLLAWLIMQLGDVLAPALRLPDWVPSLLAFFLILGFPLALFLSWAFELTADGLKLERSVDESSPRAARTGRLLNIAIGGLLLLVVAYFLGNLLIADPEQGASAEKESTALSSDRSSSATDAVATTSIAVLPFANVSQDANQEYFSDGITEEIINSLVNIPGLSVPARTTVFAFKGQDGDIREIGQSLGVENILEGSVRSVGSDAKITASLIRVSDGSRLWSKSYERRLENIFALQAELATEIATQLRLELVDIDTVPNRTADMNAYDSFLRGRAALRKRDSSALALFEQATNLDPSFAPAWASLAIAYQTYTFRFDLTIAAAERALAIDPDNVDALNALASVHRQARRWSQSEDFYRRALAIDPASAELLEDYVEFLNLVGRSAQALDVSTTAVEIDPRLAPLAAAHVEALFSNGEHLKARQLALDLLPAFGDSTSFWWAVLPLWLSPVNGELGPLPPTSFYPDGASYVQRVLQASPSASVAALKQAMAPGWEGDSRVPISRRTARLLLLHFGEVDFVIDRDIADHSVFPDGMREWLWTPYFEEYRQHARFPEFLAKVGLVAYWESSGFPSWCEKLPTNELDCR